VTTPDRVREMFKGLENAEGSIFFENVADDVDWTVIGTRVRYFRDALIVRAHAYLDSSLVADLSRRIRSSSRKG